MASRCSTTSASLGLAPHRLQGRRRRAGGARARCIARIKELGATSYLEVVSTSAEACLQSARVARELGVDRLLGGTQVEEVLAILAGSERAVPAVPRPAVRSPDAARAARPRTIAADCRRFRALGVRGRRSARVSRDRGRSARARARGAATRWTAPCSSRAASATRRADPRARRGRRRCVHRRLGGVRRLVRAARRLAALAAESSPRCLPLIRSRSCSRARIPIRRPASCSRAESRAVVIEDSLDGVRGRARRRARRSAGTSR